MKKTLPFTSCRGSASIFYKDFDELNEIDPDNFLDNTEVKALIHGYKLIGNLVSVKIDVSFGEMYISGWSGWIDHKTDDIFGKCLGIDNNCIKIHVINSDTTGINNQDIFVPLEAIQELNLIIPEYKSVYKDLLHKTNFDARNIRLGKYEDKENHIVYGKNIIKLDNNDIIVANQINELRDEIRKNIHKLIDKLNIEGVMIQDGYLVNTYYDKFIGRLIYCDNKYLYIGLGDIRIRGKEYGTHGQCVWHTDIDADLYLCIGYSVNEIKLVIKNERLSGSREYARCKTSIEEYIQSDKLVQALIYKIDFKKIEKLTTYLNSAGISELVIVTNYRVEDNKNDIFYGYKEKLDNGDVICIVPTCSYKERG